VFEWILEVDEDALGDDRGRIQIIVEYQMNSLTSSSSLSASSPSPQQQQQQQRERQRERGEPAAAVAGGGGSRRGRRHRQRSTSSDSSVYNRITAHVDIQRDNTYAIVPVVKVSTAVHPRWSLVPFSLYAPSPPHLTTQLTDSIAPRIH